MKSIGEALREIAASFTPTAAVTLPLWEARGLVLADDVTAAADLPGFDNSAMDGYAIRHAELASLASLPVRGESRAGGAWPEPLEPGSAMRILTGAAMPDGADTVLMQEDADVQDGVLRVRELPALGANVRRRGSDLAQGCCALAAGTRLGPGEVALLASLDSAQVRVHRKPRVAIVCTGDELRELGTPARSGSLVNSNGMMLAAQVERAGCEPWLLPSAGDELGEITARIEQALTADAVLTVGGVSVGTHDLVAQAFERARVSTRFWKVAMKPGKPLLFGMRDAVPVVGLPGNPVSSFVTFELLVRPALGRMAGLRAPFPTPIDVVLAHGYQRSASRTELVRANLARDAHGVLQARLHTRQGSGSIPSIAGVDALVLLPRGLERMEAGHVLQALLLAGMPGCAEPQVD